MHGWEMHARPGPTPWGTECWIFWAVLFVRMLALLIAQGQAPAGKYYYILFWQIPRQSGRQMMLIVLGGSSSLCARCVALVYETEKKVTLMHAQPHKNEHRHGIWLAPQSVRLDRFLSL